MARPRKSAGELGAVQVTKRASGKFRARARVRDDAGKLHQLQAVGDSEQGARDQLERKVAQLSTGGASTLRPESTLADACAAWLPTVHARASAGGLSFSTYESYETTVRLTILPACGGVELRHFTAGRCDRVLQRLSVELSPSAARRARSVLSLVCGFAVRDEAMVHNPVRDAQRLPLPEKKTTVLTPEQITAIRELMTHWREDTGMGPRPNWRALVDGMDIMLGTSARVGECLGLRRCDVDVTTLPPTVLINGTVTQNKTQGIRRKSTPKRARQRREVSLPARAAEAIRRRLALAEKDPEALLFATGTGAPMSVSNYERLLRSFINDHRDDLTGLGVDADEYSTHIYRRTTATLVERAAGITLASRLLGHANEQITRASYVVSAEQVDPVTVDILDTILGE